MGDHAGRHFLQIPGPTNTPLPVLAAIAKPTIDRRGPEFRSLALDVLSGIRTIFKMRKPVIIYRAAEATRRQPDRSRMDAACGAPPAPSAARGRRRFRGNPS